MIKLTCLLVLFGVTSGASAQSGPRLCESAPSALYDEVGPLDTDAKVETLRALPASQRLDYSVAQLCRWISNNDRALENDVLLRFEAVGYYLRHSDPSAVERDPFAVEMIRHLAEETSPEAVREAFWINAPYVAAKRH